MSRLVYTVPSIMDLPRHPNSQEMRQGPHLTATADLSRALKSNYSIFHPIIDIHSLQEKILSDWEYSSTSFQQFVLLSKIIREMSVSADKVEVYTSFKKNKADVLNSMRLLIEADIYPSIISPSTIEEAFFQEIWSLFEEVDPFTIAFRSKMEMLKNDSQAFESLITDMLPQSNNINIFLHGFYFITPIQQRIFHLLEQSGNKLVFIAYMDPNDNKVNEIWHKTFSRMNDFPCTNEWVTLKRSGGSNEGFANLFDGKLVSTDLCHLKLIEYQSELDFISDIPRILNNRSLYTSEYSITEKMLREYHPEWFPKRHLLSYPVGQFIWHLHSMWNPRTDQLSLTYDNLQACFASGWLEIGEVNARNYTGDLESIKVYLSHCTSIEDWKERLDQLSESKAMITMNFESHLSRVPPEHRRWHMMMGNPFLNFSCFSVDQGRLFELKKLIYRLIDIAETLFAGSGEMSISNHLQSVQKLLQERKCDQDFLKEELLIINELTKRLSFCCSPNYLMVHSSI